MSGYSSPALLCDCLENGLRVARSDLQKDARRTGWLAPALLPVLERIDADAQQPGELRLAELEFGANDSDRIRRYAIDADGNLLSAAEVGARFTDALEQLFEFGFFHGNPVLETVRMGG
jgi:hypothetical protein